MRRAWTLAAFVAVSTIVGCGGSSSVSSPSTSYITRATENTYSDDARVIAARVADASDEAWLSASVAHDADADLSAIRAAYPAVADLHARSDYDLHTIVLVVPRSASWTSDWLSGKTTTGESKLDALLTEFAPDTITPTDATGSDVVYFTLHFPQSLNMRHLATQFAQASSTIRSAQPNLIAGDGDNVSATTTDTDGNTRQYSFSQGWGDCPSGCINRHTWNFTITNDHKTTFVGESGTAVPSSTTTD